MAFMAAPAAGAAISAGASLLGGLLGQKGAKRQQAFNAQQAQKQMDFEERMSSTAHQREVADLRAAGLNPILSATGGAGESTPSGASAQGVNVDAPFGEGVSSAGQAAMQFNQLGLLKEQKRKASADADSSETDAARNAKLFSIQSKTAPEVTVGDKTIPAKPSLMSQMAQAQLDQLLLNNAGAAKTNRVLEGNAQLQDQLSKSLPDIDKAIESLPGFLQPLAKILIRQYLKK